MLRLWLLWRAARIAVPLLVVVALLAAVGRQAGQRASLTTPRSVTSITRVIGRDVGGLIARARRQLTHELQSGPQRR